MNIRTAFVSALLASGICQAANLQTRDLLFFSTHKRPHQVVGDSKNAFLLTEGGVLMYDYRKQAWIDNLVVAGQGISSIAYSSARSKLYVLLQGGATLEYNPVFRRFNSVPLSEFQEAGGAGGSVDLTGLTLDGNNFFLGDAVRDKYMRRAPITQARVFDYDNLWVLTDGLGPFFGSMRRKQAEGLWFGLDFPAAEVIYPEGGNLWFGSCRSDYSAVAGGSGIAAQSNGALVRAKADLNGWKVYPSQLESGFGDGCVRDVKAWRDFIWLATDKGVVRHDPRTGQFRHFRHMMGSVDIRVNALHVHGNRLHAATERGVAFLEDPGKDDFRTLGEMPVPGGLEVYELETNNKDLWAATRYGLFVNQAGAWKGLDQVSGKDVPEANQIAVPSVLYRDSSLYWISGNKIMVKPRKRDARVLLDRDRPIRLKAEGHHLFVAFYSGVTAFDLRKGLWTDFRLEDGIPGTQVLSVALSPGKLWIGTDAGVQRINIGPYLP